MATITEAASGFPSSNGHIPFECGTLAEVLGERGWNTYMTGKWHLTPEDEMNLASTKNQWPIGRGFERFYGFLGAETNQWYPELVYDNGWACAFNTPFKLWKRYSNWEGGTADPMIVSWPAKLKQTGVRRHYTHAVDIVPTIYQLLGVDPPEVVKGYTQHPIEGVSFAATFDDADATTDKQTQFYSMGGTRAIWHQGWKAAAVSPSAPEMWAHYSVQRWELFDTDTDPTECHDLADQHPERLQQLIGLWWHEAGRYGALPLENRGVVEILTTERPQLSKDRSRYIYYPGGSEVPESAAPNTRNRSYSIAVEVTIDTEEAGGVLFAHGSRFGGHALYIKDRKLKYVYNFVGLQEQIIESTEPVPTGHVVLSASFEREGDAMPTEGTLTLHMRRGSRRRRQDQDTARKVLDRGRGPEHRQGGRRARHRRLPRRVPMAVRRRDDPQGRHRRQRQAVRGSGQRGPHGVRAGLNAHDRQRCEHVAEVLERHRRHPGNRRVRRQGDPRGRRRLHLTARPHRGLRQRRHVVVRETDAD